MPTLSQYLDSSYPKQVLELVPVTVSGGTATFRVVYGGSPANDVNKTTGISYQIQPQAAGLPIQLTNYSAYSSLYSVLGDPSISKGSTNVFTLDASVLSFGSLFPSLASLPGPILEFSIPYPSGPILLLNTDVGNGYAPFIEYSDDPRFPSLVSATASGATVVNTIGAVDDKFDYFSLVVPSGISFDTLTLSGLQGSGTAAYTIYKAGSVEASTPIVASGVITGTSPGVTIGKNLLSNGTVTTTALGSGLYTIKLEKATSGELAYQLDFGSYISLPNFAAVEDQPFSIALPDKTSKGNALTWQASPGLPAGVQLQALNGVATLVGQTESNSNGVKPFGLTATEVASQIQTVYSSLSLSLSPVNDAPTLSSVSALSGGVEDNTKTITYPELAEAANEADVDGDALSFRIESVTSGSLKKATTQGLVDVTAGATLISAGESLQWLPAANANGLLNAFTISAVDASLSSSPPVQVKVNVGSVNDLPAGAVTLSGTATQNQQLTVSNTLADADGLGNISYRWERSASGTTGWAAISGSTATNYSLTQADVNQFVRAVASYTDGQNTVETLASAATGKVANMNDFPAGSVTLSGIATQNQLLTASNTLADVDGLGSISYRWERAASGSNSWTAINGAAASTYSLSQSDVNQQVRAVASYTDGQNTVETVASAATSPVVNVNDAPSGAVTLSGTATQNQLLTASNTLADVDGLVSISYRWERAASGSNSWTAINGAAASTYSLSQSDVNQQVRAVASYTDSQNTVETVASAATGKVVNVNDVPTLSTVSTISGGLEDTFKEISFDALVSAANAVDIDGDAISFRIETISSGTTLQKWSGGAWAAVTPGSTLLSGGEKLQWKAGADANGLLNAFTVKAWDGAAASSTAVQVSVNMAAVNDLSAGSVTLSGIATQNQLLTASNTLADVDGLGSISYRWERAASGSNSWTAINGAAASTYSLSQSDVNQQVRAVASYNDSQNTVETVASAATSPVVNVNDVPTGAVTLSGTATQNQVLTASNTLADVDGLGSISYRWERSASGTTGWAAISGSTATNYSLTQADVNQFVRAVASYTDSQNTVETVASSATGKVVNVNDVPTLSTVSTISGGLEDTFKEISFDALVSAANAVDIDGDAISFRIETISSGTTLQKWSGGAWAAVTPGSTLLSGGEKLQWKAGADANGLLNAFTVKAWDGAAASSTAVQVSVSTAAVDDAPRLAASKTYSIRENSPFTSDPFSVVEVDQDAYALSLEGPDANLFTLNSNGSLSLKAPGNYEVKADYSVTLRATDSSSNGLSSTSQLVLNISDQPDQLLYFSPQSLAFIPTVDRTVTLNGIYSQDQPLPGSTAPGSFSSVLSYDGMSLDLDTSSLRQPGLTIANDDRGSQGASTLTISSSSPAQVGSFKLDFNVMPSALGPFAFSWTLEGASEYEQQINSSIIVSPDADAFITNGLLNLSAFRTPLRISTSDKQVRLLNQVDVVLPFQRSINAVKTTDSADELLLNQSLNFDLAFGDDVVDLRSLSSQSQPSIVNGLLGGGRDTVILPVFSPASPLPSVKVGDFELGFDQLQLNNGSLVKRRSDVLTISSDPIGALAQTGIDLRFAAIAADLEPGVKSLVSGQGSVVPFSIALDPGSDGRRLQVNLTGVGSTSNQALRLSLLEASLPMGYSWVVAPDGSTATLALPATFSLASGLADLRSAVSSLTAESANPAEGSLQLRWLDVNGNSLVSTVAPLQILPQLPVSNSAPIKLEFQVGLDSKIPAQLSGSGAGDTIMLISDAFDHRTDKVFGAVGDDLLIAGDGDRLIGGIGSDTLIARLGLGSTQLSGGVGNDLLIGGQNDALIGGDGADILVVRGLGNRLSGGQGSDLFVLLDSAFATSTGSAVPNRILDFTSGDKLAFNVTGMQINDFSIVDSAAGATIRLSEPWAQRFGVTDLAILQGVKSHSVLPSQIIINPPEARIGESIVSRVDVLDQTS